MSDRPNPPSAAPVDRTLVWWGLISVAMGVFAILIAAGVVPRVPGDAEAPAWVAFAAGLIFVLGGVAVILQSAGGASPTTGELPPGAPLWLRQAQTLLVLAVTVALASIGSWVAFGHGERAFGLSLGGFDTSAAPIFGRFAFGLGAVITWLYVAAVAVRLFRART